jgi:hypothetical protein
VDGVTSAIQTQIDSKQATITDNSIAPARLQYDEGTAGSGTYYRGDGKWMSPSGSGDMVEATWATGGAINVSGATSYEWGACGSGAGDVIGPSSAIDGGIALFDTTTGKLIKDSTYTITAAGGAILDDVDAAAQRTTLAAAPIASPTFTGTVTMPTPFTLGATSVTPTGTELNYVDGVTSSIQTQFGNKADTASPTFTGTVTIPTPFTLGATSVTSTGAELNYVDGVTSAIQTQLNAKQATITDNSIAPSRLQYDEGTAGSTTYYRGDGKWMSPAGTGDVYGPASSTDSSIVLFDGTGGKLLKDSGYSITAAGAALLDDADISAQRITLGLDNMALQADNNVLISGGALSGVTITGSTMVAKQDSDADLTTLSTPGNDKIFYSTDAGVIQEVTLGTSGTFLKSNGLGSAPTFSTISATPGGSDTHVQFNDGGAFGGDSGFVYDKDLDSLTIDNTVTAAAFNANQSASVAGNVKLYELSGNGSNYLGFSAPDAITGNFQWELPDGDGTSGQVLKTDAAGSLYWSADSTGGSPTFDTVGAGTNTNALLVGTGGTLGPTGSGTITATDLASGATGSSLALTGNLSGMLEPLNNVTAPTAAQTRGQANYITSAGTVQLPTAAPGQSGCYYSTTAAVISVKANTGDEIKLNGAGIGVGEKISSPGATGNFICIHAFDSTYWYTWGQSGTWVDGGA